MIGMHCSAHGARKTIDKCGRGSCTVYEGVPLYGGELLWVLRLTVDSTTWVYFEKEGWCSGKITAISKSGLVDVFFRGGDGDVLEHTEKKANPMAPDIRINGVKPTDDSDVRC